MLVDDPGGGGRWIRTVSMPADALGGATTEYWETQWAEEKVEAVPHIVEVLRPHLAGRDLVLEAGCGLAPFVAALATPDNDVIGIDLADRALATAHQHDPSLRLGVADVQHLPFPDGTFDAVLSLGVVEHFQGGPVAVLREHARVLAADGVLLLTVPRRSWLRAARDVWHLGVRREGSYPNRSRTVTRRRVGVATEVPGAFHQYEWSAAQLRGFLRQAGLEVRSWQAIDVGSALGEAGLSRFAARPAPAAAPPVEPASGPSAPAATASGPSGLRGFVSSALLDTKPVGPLGRVVRRLGAGAIGHLQFVVAVPARSGR